MLALGFSRRLYHQATRNQMRLETSEPRTVKRLITMGSGSERALQMLGRSPARWFANYAQALQLGQHRLGI